METEAPLVLFHLESFFSAYISELMNLLHYLIEIFRHTGLVKRCWKMQKIVREFENKRFVI